MIDDRDAERCKERCQEPFPDLVVGKVWLERPSASIAAGGSQGVRI